MRAAFWRGGRAPSPYVDREQTYALVLALAGIVLVTFATVAILMDDSSTQSARRALRPPPVAEQTPDRSVPGERLDVAEYVDRTHGYGFEYPANWTVSEDPPRTSLQNPTGRIRLLFGLGPSGDLDVAASRLVESLSDVTSNPDLIGMTREKIDGSRSLLVSGTALDDAGRRVRFLAITVRSEPENYAISIFVPRESDPVRILPRIEEIVSSFDVLSTGAEISA
jgi:hypothetical protein